MKTPKILMSLLMIIGIAFACFAVQELIIGDLINAIAPGGVSMAIVFGSIAMPEDIGYEDGSENMGGLGIKAYLALYDDIDVWPTEPSEPTNLAEAVVLSGNFEMVAGKNFFIVYVSPDTMDMNPEGQGEPGGRSFKNKASFFLPAFSPENRGLARRLNNSRGVLIIPDDTGTFRLCVGNEQRPAFFKPSGSSGKKAADPKGFTYECEADSFAPGHTYNGTIPISGSTEPAIS